ncbi:MAG: penicillin-binding protein 2 [Chloroflexi bacterium]|nr:penicillin-binding protein 2 [Chloroflexota bacterium]
MFDRRVLHLARIAVVSLVLASVILVYWQTAHSAALNPFTIRPAINTQWSNSPGQAPAQADQEFIAGVSQALDLENQPAPVVQRTIDLLKRIRRGAIYDRNGRQLVVDRQGADGTWERFYNEPSLAHAVGYVSGLRIGVTGIERSYNTTLLGLDRPDAQIDQLLHRPIQGSDLILTIDTPTQRLADNALHGKQGAIVVLDEHNGAVLAMASSPRFDPNRIHEESYLHTLLAACDGTTPCQGALINRASQSAYSPGSTWKTVSLIAALDSGQVHPGTIFDFGAPVQGPNGPYYIYTVDGGVIPDPNHSERRLDLTMSYAKSANAAFAKIGDQMPADILLSYARKLGFGKPGEVSFPLEIEYTPSQIAWDTDSLYSNNLLRAATSIGQGEVLASPLNMGMVVLSVLNGGRMPIPYFVQSIREPSGRIVEATRQPGVENIMRPQTAQEVRDMMVATVTRGTGQKAAVPGLVVGGKTGTAQVGGDAAPHSWFVGFAESGGRGVVIAVVIENGGEGSQAAASIFSEIAQVAVGRLGEGAGLPPFIPGGTANP